ncbi:IS3 family transposase, partial [Escherichia coli]|uniref:IS3 family transposase n=1 Tax=Escherichia coli TaxID=562 RepID=UPI002027845D
DDCWKGWAILLRQKQKKLIMLPSETMIWQPEFTDKTLSRKPGAVHRDEAISVIREYIEIFYNRQRRHSRLGNISPAAFREKYHQMAA